MKQSWNVSGERQPCDCSPSDVPDSLSNPMVGLVNHILTQSFVDGPGNRAVIFLQGCNLHCQYCHNPFTIQRCTHCGACVDACPQHALSILKGRVVWDSTHCVECETCTQICPHYSSPRVKEMTPAQIWEVIAPASPFLSGISVSGGEPTLQMSFLVELFRLVGAKSTLTRLIETNGQVGGQAYQPLMAYLDMAMVDLKSIDPQTHLRLTGRPLEPTLDAIRYLHAHGKLYAVQQVIVPGFTDTLEHAAATARFLATIDAGIRLKFLRFRAHGTRGEALKWATPSLEQMEHLVQAARDGGLSQVSCSL